MTPEPQSIVAVCWAASDRTRPRKAAVPCPDSRNEHEQDEQCRCLRRRQFDIYFGVRSLTIQWLGLVGDNSAEMNKSVALIIV
jgi:hypothetical protein